MLFLSCACYAFAHICLLMLCGHLLETADPSAQVLMSYCVFVTFPCGIMSQVLKHVIKYCEKAYERSGKNLFWFIKHQVKF